MQSGEKGQMGWSAKKRGKGGETVAADGDVKKHSGELRGEDEEEKREAMTAWKGKKRRKAKKGVKKANKHFIMVNRRDTVSQKCKTEA